jgi:hypothetical protein
MNIIITESQYNDLFEVQMLMESIFEVESLSEFKSELKKLVRKLLLMGVAAASIGGIISNYCDKNGTPPVVKKEVMSDLYKEWMPDFNYGSMLEKYSWKLVDSKTTATVYNAVPAQCNGDFGVTANMFRLNLNDVLSHRIIAMERTFMKKLGINYGDLVKIEGTDGYDGIWQVQDTMNKRFAGQHKIDILVPENVKKGMWDNVRIYKLTNPQLASELKSKMAPPVSKAESIKQMKQKRAEWKKAKMNKKSNKNKRNK